ncbi:transcriptional regulator [Leminorella grimontii]|uniref:Transcriptional regulator n=1 Tax=Leminorella grimontii TaxID=82981 RepID=A0AAV5N1S3_9GAMM|nr:YafY family protein [Leminorella grimontii]KFC96185.1 DeoR family transcriptional regulator [Leminorella grimontii ATCC 33999 = DSM 5078]GKX54627.1 transcriptional regulator [Leminorella grimontii]VFS58794.1 Proteasome accessory factor C [Leminorella grimontii]
MKIDRIVAILMALLEKDKISAARLAEMFEVSVRTIYRDVDTLARAGIPIVTEPGPNGGIGVIERFKVDKRLFSSAEISTLLTGLNALSPALSTPELSAARAKVRSLIPPQRAEEVAFKSGQVAIDLTSWTGYPSHHVDLNALRDALEKHWVLEIHYEDGDGAQSVRRVEPYQLLLKEQRWYLRAYCLQRNDFRTFKLSRIVRMHEQNTVFTPRPFNPTSMACSAWIDPRLIDIELIADKVLREALNEYCPPQNITPTEDGRLHVVMPFVPDERGYRLLLSFGTRCTCIGPESVRRELMRYVQALYSHYELLT